MKIYKLKLLFSLLLLSTFFTSCTFAGIEAKISGLVNKPDQKNVQYGIYIVQAQSGRKIYSRNHTSPMIPASNMKLVTTAAALNYLGTDFEFETKVGLCGKKLAIIAGGDPLLGDEKVNAKYSRSRFWPIDDISQKLKSMKIVKLEGIIADTTVFDDNRVHSSWPIDQLNKWYACEISGLNFNNNCVDFIVTNNRGNIVYSLEPQTGFLEVVNQTRPISKGNSAVGAYRTPQENRLYLKGNVNRGARFTLAIERPAAFFAYFLAENLISQGIGLNGRIVEGPLPSDCDFELIETYKTPVTDVIERSNRDSLGLASEALLKKIGCDRFGLNGSWQSGAKQVARYLNGIGISDSQFEIDDGSGLSRNNRLSPKALVNVLKDMYNNPEKWDIIFDSLSVGGVDGTASRWFQEPQYQGKLFLKTGYINGVRSYSGVCKTKQGDLLFSIITNNSNGKSRNVMNEILKSLIDQYDN